MEREHSSEKKDVMGKGFEVILEKLVLFSTDSELPESYLRPEESYYVRG